MAGYGSSAPAAKAALVAALQASADLAGVQVTYGSPGALRENDILAVLDIAGEQSVGNNPAPNRTREEDYTLTLIASVYRGDDDQQAVTERAYALMAVVESVLRANRTLTGTVDSAAVSGRVELAEARPQEVKPGGRVAELTFEVECKYRAHE